MSAIKRTVSVSYREDDDEMFEAKCRYHKSADFTYEEDTDRGFSEVILEEDETDSKGKEKEMKIN